MIYYHGTAPDNLYSIMTKGFRFSKEKATHGRVNGDGLYVSVKPETTANWSMPSWWQHTYAIKCKLEQGTRILWLEKDYCKKTLRTLERKFTKKVSRNYDFYKYIPQNKHLTAQELVTLLSCLHSKQFIRWGKKRDRFWQKRDANLGRLSEALRRCGYDALGNRSQLHWDSDEILVYNPSRVVPISAHRTYPVWDASNLNLESFCFGEILSREACQTISQKEEEFNRAYESLENLESSERIKKLKILKETAACYARKYQNI